MSIFQVDLHSHTTASDGAFTPTQLVERALARGLTHLAITDHDAVGGIDEAIAAAGDRLTIIPGIEVSITWREKQIHIAGLFIDHHSKAITDLVAEQHSRREERAERIAARLERQGIKDVLARTRAMAAPGATITRGNFSRFLASAGYASSADEAFNVYLKKGKCAYVKTTWVDVGRAVDAIHQAGGRAVIAHPGRYEITNTKRRRLIEDFAAVGGDGMEVAAPQQGINEFNYLCSLCERYHMLYSFGSDFHSDESPWRDLGLNLRLKEGLTPIYSGILDINPVNVVREHAEGA